MKGIVGRALRKCFPSYTNNGVWCAYLTPTEFIALVEGNHIRSERTDKPAIKGWQNEIEHEKRRMKKGLTCPWWRYFIPITDPKSAWTRRPPPASILVAKLRVQ